jgi:hypothetical protein
VSKITVQDQLKEIEALILDFRWARDTPSAPEWRTFQVLKIIAANLRAQLPGAAEEARASITRRFGDLDALRARIGGELGVLQELNARWPAISHAIEVACRIDPEGK